VLPLEVPIKSGCCGAAHTFLLSMDESKILAFGSNEKGQLGMPMDIDHVTQPTEINMEKMFDGYQLKLVACGAMHTAFVTGTVAFIYPNKSFSFQIKMKWRDR
jgi:alpha-tubulin suppressor-like RCC1 family protein